MEIYDVSVPVREAMPVYDGNPGVSLSRAQSIAAGDHANVTRLELGAHTGTHVDAPLLICLPVRFVGSDGAPARAVLVRD